jgi:hypothetical protein
MGIKILFFFHFVLLISHRILILIDVFPIEIIKIRPEKSRVVVNNLSLQ